VVDATGGSTRGSGAATGRGGGAFVAHAVIDANAVRRKKGRIRRMEKHERWLGSLEPSSASRPFLAERGCRVALRIVSRRVEALHPERYEEEGRLGRAAGTAGTSFRRKACESTGGTWSWSACR
jgi:hypothetical protein